MSDLAIIQGMISSSKADKIIERAISITPNNPYPYNAYAFMLMDKGNNNEAEKYFKKALSLSTRQEEKAHISVNLGILYKNTGRFSEAISILEEGRILSSQVNDKENEVKCLNNLGACYHNIGQSNKAIESLDDAFSKVEELIGKTEYPDDRRKYKSLQANILTNQGISYKNMFLDDNNQKNIDEAISLFTRAKDIEESLGNESLLGRHYGNLAEAYRLNHDMVSSKKYLMKCMDIFKIHGSLKEKLTCRLNLALHASTSGDENKAIELYESLLLDKDIEKYLKIKALALSNCGSVYIKIGDIEQGKELLNRALPIAKACQYKKGIEYIEDVLSEID